MITNMHTWRRKLSGQQDILASLAIFIILTIFLLYPASLHPNSVVLGRPFDDVFEHIWYLEWYKQALFDLRVSPLFQPDIFYPGGWELGFAALPPLFPSLLSPLTALIGSVATYNLVLVGSTILAALGVFMLHRAMGGNFLGGIFAGMVFAFYPNRQTFMHGFMNFLLGSVWLPWMLYAVYLAVQRPRSRTRWLALAGLAYALSISGAWQFTYISTITLIVFSVFLVIPSWRRDWRSWLRPLAAFALVASIISGPFLINGLAIQSRLASSTNFTLNNLINTSTSLENLLAPSIWNPLVRNWVIETFPEIRVEDNIASLGIIVIITALLGLFLARPWKREHWALLGLVVAGLLFMAGPFLQFKAEPISMTFLGAKAIAQAFPMLKADNGGLMFPMPALIVNQLFAVMRSFHHFGRFEIMVTLGAGILAGLGITQFSTKFDAPAGRLFGIAAIIILLLEFNTQPQPQVTRIDAVQRPVDTWLASLPERHVIMEYPLWYSMKAHTLYHSSTHQQSIVHGYSVMEPVAFTQMRPILEMWPEEPAINLLQDIGVRYILINVTPAQTQFETSTLPELLSNERLKLVARFPIQAKVEPEESYFFGLITPEKNLISETIVLELISS